MIDLHVHSTASDGQYSPSQIIQKASEKNIKVIAITDHDTTAGLEEAKNEGKKLGVTVVPGIEINITFPTGEFHLLGLGLKKPSKSLNNIGDSFKKIIVVKDNIKLWRNDDGILIIGIQEFLLNKDSLDL